MNNQRLIAEIRLRSTCGQVGWNVFSPGTEAHQATGLADSRVEALRDAVQRVRAFGEGRVGVISEDGHGVAYLETTNPVDYQDLAWSPSLVGQVDLAALAISSRVA